MVRAGPRVRRQADDVRQLPVEHILLSPYQARKQASEEGLAELVESIRQHGVLQPILVRPFGGGYELVAGERRLRACKMAGIRSVPAVVRKLSDSEAAIVGLVENLQRENLSFLEEAAGYQRMIDEFNLTQQEVAARVGRSQPAVANKLRLLRLDERVRAGVMVGGLSERHARALLRLGDVEDQLSVVEAVVNNELTVKATEELIDSIARSGEDEQETRRETRIVHVVKDVRILLNSFRQAVKMLKRNGVAVEMEERSTEDCIEVVVRIPNNK